MNRFSIAATILVTALGIAGCASDDGDGSTPSNGPYGKWRVVEIGNLVAGAADTTLEIAQDGTVSGAGGCNGYGGNAVITGGAIEFGPLISTMMACEPSIMDQELAYLTALKTVQGWRHQGGDLVLFDASAQALVRLEPVATLTADEQAEADAAAAEANVEAADELAEAEAIVEEVEPGEIVEEIAIALPEPMPASSETVFYDCAGREVEATYINAGDISLATLQIGEDFVVASNVIAASGARYSGGQYIWWVKGNQADLVDFRNGGMEAVITCQAQ